MNSPRYPYPDFETDAECVTEKELATIGRGVLSDGKSRYCVFSVAPGVMHTVGVKMLEGGRIAAFERGEHGQGYSTFASAHEARKRAFRMVESARFIARSSD